MAKKSSGDSKLFAFLAVFLSIIGFVIALLAKKKDKYVMHYAKRSLIIFLIFVISGALVIIPIIGWITSPILYIVALVLWIITLINSVSGEKRETPLIEEYAKKIEL